MRCLSSFLSRTTAWPSWTGRSGPPAGGRCSQSSPGVCFPPSAFLCQRASVQSRPFPGSCSTPGCWAQRQFRTYLLQPLAGNPLGRLTAARLRSLHRPGHPQPGRKLHLPSAPRAALHCALAPHRSGGRARVHVPVQGGALPRAAHCCFARWQGCTQSACHAKLNRMPPQRPVPPSSSGPRLLRELMRAAVWHRW